METIYWLRPVAQKERYLLVCLNKELEPHCKHKSLMKLQILADEADLSFKRNITVTEWSKYIVSRRWSR